MVWYRSSISEQKPHIRCHVYAWMRNNLASNFCSLSNVGREISRFPTQLKPLFNRCENSLLMYSISSSIFGQSFGRSSSKNSSFWSSYKYICIFRVKSSTLLCFYCSRNLFLEVTCHISLFKFRRTFACKEIFGEWLPLFFSLFTNRAVRHVTDCERIAFCSAHDRTTGKLYFITCTGLRLGASNYHSHKI